MRAEDPRTVQHNVGRRVAELRTAKGWTQEEFSVLADVTVGYVRQVEAGSENLTIASLVHLASLLDVEIADLFQPPTSKFVRRGRPPKASRGEK